MTRTETRLFPALLRHYRNRRGLSQLDLALAAEVSSRHISFLETGRAQPSREMVLRLGSTLSVALRDQNAMLEAAGYAAEHPEPSLAEGMPRPIQGALERMMAQQEPYPLTVLDRRYDVLLSNGAATRILPLFVADPSALGARINVFHMLFDRRLARDFVVDWEHVARAFVSRLHREALAHPEDDELSRLLDALFRYPDVPRNFRQPDFSTPSEPTLSLRLKRGDLRMGFLTMVTTFNAPQNITLEEVRIESYFPLDDETARTCERLRREG
jgi:transcriptional regulator with XRE-family HTH domain